MGSSGSKGTTPQLTLGPPDEEDEGELLLKILLLGETHGHEKSILLLLYTDPDFEQFKTTIGIDFKIHRTQVDGRDVCLQIWGLHQLCSLTT